jgi:hypothetical protein
MDVALVVGIVIAGVTIGAVTIYDRFKQEKKLEFNISKKIVPNKAKIKTEFLNRIFDRFASFRMKRESGTEKKDVSGLKGKFARFGTLFGRSKSFKGFSLFSPFGFLRLRQEKKIKEIDEKLEKVVNESPSHRKKEVEIDDSEVKKILEEKLDTFDVDDNLLSEMETAERVDDLKKYSDEIESAENLNSDVVVDTDDLDFGIDIANIEDSNEELDDESVDEDFGLEMEAVEVDFDDKDDLLSSLQKEISVKKEEKLDLLRDLRNENLDLKELKRELEEVLGTLKLYAKSS